MTSVWTTTGKHVVVHAQAIYYSQFETNQCHFHDKEQWK